MGMIHIGDNVTLPTCACINQIEYATTNYEKSILATGIRIYPRVVLFNIIS